jgi:hypothetical protein
MRLLEDALLDAPGNPLVSSFNAVNDKDSLVR